MEQKLHTILRPMQIHREWYRDPLFFLSLEDVFDEVRFDRVVERMPETADELNDWFREEPVTMQDVVTLVPPEVAAHEAWNARQRTRYNDMIDDQLVSMDSEFFFESRF